MQPIARRQQHPLGGLRGVDLVVETQGSSGATPLDPAVVRDAEAVVFAVDVDVRDRGRFAGKPVVASGVKRAINEPAKMVAEAVAAADNPNAAKVEGSGADADSAAWLPAARRREARGDASTAGARRRAGAAVRPGAAARRR